jgi:hypothetical protein
LILLNTQQQAEGCFASNFMLKGDNMYWLVLDQKGFRVSFGIKTPYSENLYIPIDAEKVGYSKQHC